MSLVDKLAATVKGLGDAAAWMTADEARLATILVDSGQDHIFAAWGEGAVDKKHAFFGQVRAMGETSLHRERIRATRRAHPAHDSGSSCNSRASQVTALEGGYPGGVAAYVANARTLLRSSAAGENPFDGMKPEVSVRAGA